MKQILIILFTLNSCFSMSQGAQRKAVLKTFYLTVEKWEDKISTKYRNQKLIEIIEKLYSKRYEEEVTSNDTLDLLDLLEDFEKNDTVTLEGVKILYSKSLKSLKRNKKNRLHAKSLMFRYKSKNVLNISTPIFSSNKRRALIYVEAQCGLLCGSGEFFVFLLKDEKWIFESRIIKYIG